MTIREYTAGDIPAMNAVWNEVVEEGIAFPQEDFLDLENGTAFFASQSYCGVAEDDSDPWNWWHLFIGSALNIK